MIPVRGLRKVSIAVFSPLAALLLIEGGLRLAGYGYNSDFFVASETPGRMVVNEKFLWRFAPPHIAGDPDLTSFSAVKTPGTYRVFVLGGSAAKGTPDPAFSFSHMLETMLDTSCTGRSFEVINTGVAAMKSHVVRLIADECLKYKPDMLIFYLGNNEVVGPFGPGTVFRPFASSLRAIRAGILLSTTRTGQLLLFLQRRLRGENRERGWRGMAEFAENKVAHDDPRLEQVYEFFGRNLKDSIGAAEEHGVKTLVCTPAVNLRDCAPFASAEGDDQAEATHRRARLLEEKGQHSAAHDAFVEARDLDMLRFRADSRIGDTIRKTVSDRTSRLVELVDTARILPTETPGDELFYEHVHLNPAGNYAVALGLFREIIADLPAAASEPPGFEECMKLAGFTDWHAFTAASLIQQLTDRPPFTGQFDHIRKRMERINRLRELRSRLSPEVIDLSIQLAETRLARHPDDALMRRKLARLLAARGDYEQAKAELQTLLQQFPEHPDLLFDMGNVLLADGKKADGERFFQQSIKRSSNTLERRLQVAEAYALQKQWQKAFNYLSTVLLADPEIGRAQMLLGEVMVETGRPQMAVDHFIRASQLMPLSAEPLMKCGSVLLMLGDVRAATGFLRKAVEHDPRYAAAHFNLARAYLAIDRTEDAVAAAEMANELTENEDPRVRAVLEEAYSRAKANTVP